jgi:PTH1 family peptidyl-tRNA hydrolase
VFLVAGLGNPGEKYAATPHNLGFLVVDVLAARHSIRMSRVECQAVIGQGSIGGKPVLLAKPQTFMNLSGVAVKPLMQKNEVDPKDLILIYDELALPWGSLRIRPDGSAAGHNGVQDVIDKIGTQSFPRVRLGAHPGYPLVQGTGKDYLL